uniref:Uncharacterized protein n=1 Tax=Arundo donax TaxID=35708 RepID=A0A0A9BIP8_ARUDO
MHKEINKHRAIGFILAKSNFGCSVIKV